MTGWWSSSAASPTRWIEKRFIILYSFVLIGPRLFSSVHQMVELLVQLFLQVDQVHSKVIKVAELQAVFTEKVFQLNDRCAG